MPSATLLELTDALQPCDESSDDDATTRLPDQVRQRGRLRHQQPQQLQTSAAKFSRTATRVGVGAFNVWTVDTD